jgi:hypothetical protein
MKTSEFRKILKASINSTPGSHPAATKSKNYIPVANVKPKQGHLAKGGFYLCIDYTVCVSSIHIQTLKLTRVQIKWLGP